MSEIGSEFVRQSRALLEDYQAKIERCLTLLSDEQIWWRANPQSNSIGNLLLHLSGNVRQWIVVGLGDTPDMRDRDSEFAQRDVILRAELLDRLKLTLREADATLAGFDQDKLLETFPIQGLEVSALEAILHVVEHFSMHTGQIIMLAKMFAEVDLEFYDFKGWFPVPTWKA
jgi:uncharacterized damage-inducible protein DinB